VPPTIDVVWDVRWIIMPLDDLHDLKSFWSQVAMAFFKMYVYLVSHCAFKPVGWGGGIQTFSMCSEEGGKGLKLLLLIPDQKLPK
jgi:hypothetical protein